jgi:hypothetical protein
MLKKLYKKNGFIFLFQNNNDNNNISLSYFIINNYDQKNQCFNRLKKQYYESIGYQYINL